MIRKHAILLTLLTLPSFLLADSYNTYHPSPLHAAVFHQDVKAVKNLLHNKPNKKDFFYKEWPVLEDAVDSGNVEIVKLLLKHGADTSAANSEGKTPVMLAEKKCYCSPSDSCDYKAIIALLKEHETITKGR